MKKITTFCASLVLVLVVSGGARAFVVDTFGTIPVPSAPILGNQPAAGGFTEEFLFKTSIDAFVVELTAVAGAGIDLTTFGVEVVTSVVDAAATPGILLATGVQRAAPDDDIFDIAAFKVDGVGTTIAGVITLGQHFVRATGTQSGTGNYSVQLTVSQIPLPPAAILFLSALAGLVGFSRIRRRKVAT